MAWQRYYEQNATDVSDARRGCEEESAPFPTKTYRYMPNGYDIMKLHSGKLIRSKLVYCTLPFVSGEIFRKLYF